MKIPSPDARDAQRVTTAKSLSAERERRGITQESLARRMGVTPARISAIESGRNKLRPATITRYMACLDLIEHDQADTGEFEMRLSIEQVRWLALFSELTEQEQAEVQRYVLEKYAHVVNRRLREEEVTAGPEAD